MDRLRLRIDEQERTIASLQSRVEVIEAAQQGRRNRLRQLVREVQAAIDRFLQ